MVTRSQQQAAWPGLQNSGTNTRKQAALQWDLCGAVQLILSISSHWRAQLRHLCPLHHHCRASASWDDDVLSISGPQRIVPTSLCHQINRPPSESSATMHGFRRMLLIPWQQGSLFHVFLGCQTSKLKSLLPSLSYKAAYM